MRYIYCIDCKGPIRATSTFEETVIRGFEHRKELKSTCGKSMLDGFSIGRCIDCQLKIMKQFGETECNVPNCRKNNNGLCEYLLNKNLVIG